MGLSREDLEEMTIGDCLDFADELIEINKPASEKVRKASQADFDSF